MYTYNVYINNISINTFRNSKEENIKRRNRLLYSPFLKQICFFVKEKVATMDNLSYFACFQDLATAYLSIELVFSLDDLKCFWRS